MNSRAKLQELLTELFQLNNTDLDFGIYRIMNLRRNELQRFIDKDLLDAVADGFEEIRKGQSHHILEELADLRNQIKHSLGNEALDADGNVQPTFRTTPLAKQYEEKKSQLADVKVSEELEAELFSDIYTFFSRYWDDGDFISRRRYSRDAKYAIPYNGEEVTLYWANHDQYYIKTAEYFNDYTFKTDSYTVHFKIASAQTEQNNVKGEKRFFLLHDGEDNVALNNADLTIRFQFRPLTEQEAITYGKQKQQEKINEAVCGKVLDAIDEQRLKALLSAVKEGEEKFLLAKHLYRYTKKNTSDYFIHKDLKGFLERELDFFIKNEVMMLDAIGTGKEVHFEKYLTKVKVLKQVCLKIIAFLAQLEDFQKRLFEKRKFVLETNYCMTLDNVPEEFYDEMLQNEAQLNAWKELFALPIDVKKKLILPQVIEQPKAKKRKGQESLELKSKPARLDKAWLKKNLNLVLDTKFFGPEFKYHLVSKMKNLNGQLSGLLIESENFQALNLISQTYNDKVSCTYIDPPYNAKSSEILYKNKFKHSSWLALIENRIALSKTLLNKNGVFVVAIDENEQEKLGLLLGNLFPDHQKTCVTVIHNPSGQQGDNFSYTSDFAYFIYPSKGRSIAEEERDKNSDTRNFRDVTGEESLRESAATCFYPILVRDGKIIGFGDVCDDTFHPASVNVQRANGTVEVYPIDPQNVERKWRYARGTVESIKNELFAHFIKGRNAWDIKRTKSNFNFKTVWVDSKYSANNHGTQLLNDILGEQLFSYPKSLFTVMDCVKAATGNDNDALVLDYFAGSATTAHAVLALNKIDQGKRKYILVEMGEYFETVVKRRIQRTMFSESWTGGRPLVDNGFRHIFKYQTLESYEDTLNNIELSKSAQSALFEDYTLRYMLNNESKVSASLLNVEKMARPFDYELEVYEKGEHKRKRVDLIETFNYLLGLEVNRIKAFRPKGDEQRIYRVVFGNLDGKTVAIIWRNTDGLDLEADKQFIEEEIIGNEAIDQLYINGDSFVPNAHPIEKTFKERMFAPLNV